jgi:hypothetical protein
MHRSYQSGAPSISISLTITIIVILHHSQDHLLASCPLDVLWNTMIAIVVI